ncbi:MAG TPA: hypothetical protein PLW80_08990, partial [Spirochaetales bacterium]|nr:hypothetical protein [Spirochaetales bacterium]
MVCSFTALDEYFGVSPAPPRFERFDGDLVGLARTADGLAFPGLPYADAVGGSPSARVLYRCSDGEAGVAYPQAALARLPAKRSFDARGGVYESLADPPPRTGPARAAPRPAP